LYAGTVRFERVELEVDPLPQIIGVKGIDAVTFDVALDPQLEQEGGQKFEVDSLHGEISLIIPLCV